ncbi:MAG: RepB family DNA primase [Actinobacteria bacterium]|nr:RepB family DNA primase [Actinomycetota bacterium]
MGDKLHIMDGSECIRVFADHAKARPPFVGHRHIAYGSEEWNRMVRKAQAGGAGVFFSVNGTDGTGAKAENITRIRTYYVDIDGLKNKTPALEMLITAALKPSAIVETKNGVHAYWYAARQTPVNYSEYRRVQVGLIKAFGGDKGAKDISRVLRVPGTLHLKNPSEPFKVRIVHQLPVEQTPYYTPEQLLFHYPSPPERERAEVRIVESPKRWEAFLEDLSNWSPVEGERNSVMLLAAGVGVAFGVAEEDYIDTMYPIVRSWETGRNELSELRRVARWAYARGNPIPPAVLKKRGVPIRRGL